jgi:imidazolonepropionase-like amidohydrolase
LPWNDALASITIDAARVIGLDQRIGSLEVGKDGDVALFDGDPLEYSTHAVGVVIDGAPVSTAVQRSSEAQSARVFFGPVQPGGNNSGS